VRVLDIFSGIGGFSLGLERAGMRTVAFCEIDPFCRAVLRKHWPDAPIYEDIRTLHAANLPQFDVICGGYPCQPFSHAGKRRGQEDDRHLWPEYFRIVEARRPAWVIGENVVGHIGMGLDAVLSDLEGIGYSCRPFVIPACAVDARHRRERVWVVAHANGSRLEGWDSGIVQERPGEQLARQGGSLPDTDDALQPDVPVNGEPRISLQEPSGVRGYAWLPEPGLGRVADGIPGRVDRLRALGNAVVPQVVQAIGEAIMTASRDGDHDEA
jgi:DNA (cytosine-5)-methyltransferase 1